MFRLFGLLFAVVAFAMAWKPRELSARRIRSPDGSLATIEPTDAQVTLLRVVAVVFGLVGLAMALGGPFALLRI
ncbi:hypothetical protein HUG10_04205 [Halorarum halophilum]|uniref:DUF6199 domain-containing protein n=1 Tax=Halorarum halophilum TaxID=2743090 RepID=A0A7D5KG15_9EURY|nr:hypothetical protein HUG10_04205 [Halobaculum halophilum]